MFIWYIHSKFYLHNKQSQSRRKVEQKNTFDRSSTTQTKFLNEHDKYIKMFSIIAGYDSKDYFANVELTCNDINFFLMRLSVRISWAYSLLFADYISFQLDEEYLEQSVCSHVQIP